MKYRKYFLLFITLFILNLLVVSAFAAFPAANAEETVLIKDVSYRCSNGAVGSLKAIDCLTAALSADFSMPGAWVEYAFVINNGASSPAKFSDIQVDLPENALYDIDTSVLSNHIGDIIPEGSCCTIKITLTATDSGNIMLLNNKPIQIRFIFEGDTVSESVSTNAENLVPSPQTGDNSNIVLVVATALISFCIFIALGFRVCRNTKANEDNYGNKEHLQ